VISPEICLIIRRNLIVVNIFLPVCSSERRILCHHYEQNNAKCKNIDTLTVIGPLFVDFWSHVVLGSQVISMQTITFVSLEGSGKSKIGNFDVEIGAEENVIRFQVSVGDASLVNVVYTFNHLPEEVSSQSLLKSSGLNQVVAHFTSSSQLQNHVDDGFVPSVVVSYNSFRDILYDGYNVVVLECTKCFNFI